jgi:hypothetical protein
MKLLTHTLGPQSDQMRFTASPCTREHSVEGANKAHDDREASDRSSHGSQRRCSQSSGTQMPDGDDRGHNERIFKNMGTMKY